jgi:hypothetical protein
MYMDTCCLFLFKTYAAFSCRILILNSRYDQKVMINTYKKYLVLLWTREAPQLYDSARYANIDMTPEANVALIVPRESEEFGDEVVREHVQMLKGGE